MYYNRLILCGRVSTEPTIRTSKTGKNFVTLRMGVKRSSKKDAIYDNFSLNAFGNIGNEILEQVHVDDYICAMGPVSGSAYTKDGRSGVNLTVLVMEWKKDPATEMTKKAEKEMEEGGTATEENENEEVLF